MTARSPRHRFTLPLLSATALLALTACGGPGAADADESGPLQKYLSALWDSEEWSNEQFEAELKQIDELTAQCMAEEGFEYQPGASSGGMVSYTTDEDLDWNSVEFAEQYGYGMVNWPGSEEMNADTGEEWVDPNQDYLESLSESEQAAYQEALYGPPMTEEQMLAAENDDFTTWDWSTAGCSGKAQHEVQGSDNAQTAYEDPEFTELFAAMDQLDVEFYGDGMGTGITNTGVQELDRKWADCMADSGESGHTTSTETRDALNTEYQELVNPYGPEITDSLTPDQILELPEPQEPDPAAIEAFKKREIALAVTDAKCREKIDYADTFEALRLESEQAFVDEHRAALDALVAKHGVKKKS